MPILLIGLLAFLVFGIIGILLSAAVFLEQSQRKHSHQGTVEPSVPSGVPPALNPKLR
jgi:hypothetical protein